MKRRLEPLTEQEYQTAIKLFDMGVRAAGLECVIPAATLFIKFTQAQQVDDSPTEAKPETKNRAKRNAKANQAVLEDVTGKC